MQQIERVPNHKVVLVGVQALATPVIKAPSQLQSPMVPSSNRSVAGALGKLRYHANGAAAMRTFSFSTVGLVMQCASTCKVQEFCQ